ncbi:MAG: hypothetical protein K9W43_08890 [Candidatus Thorarchaeota archaeon]|nr:hypothetical protein [Candidatus Thorarchaeota archaeon]
MRERGRLVRVFCAVFIIISVLSMMQRGTAAMRRARSVHITLGVNHSYSLMLDGENLNVSIVYDHGALINDNEVTLDYYEGHVYFTFTKNVTVQGGLRVHTPTYLMRDSTCFVDVDLPDALDGQLTLTNPHDITIAGRWRLKSVPPYSIGTVYATPDRSDYPLLDILLNGGGYVTGSLRS